MTSNSNANDGAVATMSVSSPFKPTSSTLAVGGVTKAGGAINTITSSTTIFPNGNRRGPLDLQVRIDTSDNKLFNRKNTTSPKKQASSSTSSSSKPTMMILPIEDLLQDKSLDINERRLLIQMDFVQRARVLIKELKHPDLQKHLEKIDTTKQKRLHLALIKDQYLLNSINVLFNYECEEANSEFMMKCEKLRQEMLDEIQQEIDDIQEQRQLLFGTTTDIISTTTKNKQQNTTTRKTRSTRSKGDKDLLTGDLLGQLVNPMVFAYDTAQKIKKKAGYVFQPLEKRLAPSEIEHDVRELTAHLEATKKRRMETKADLKELTFAKYHRSKFLYKDLILQEGDEILVLQNLPNDGLGGGSSSNGNGNEYAAIICGLTSTEIFVLSEKGKYQRLLVNDLRTNKVLFVLAPDNNNNNNNNNSSSNKRR